MQSAPGLVVRNHCRMCGGTKFRKFLDLGSQPLANSFVRKEDLAKEENKYPLEVYWCEDCSLAQLIHVVSPEILFRDYVYFSTGMPKLSNHFKEYAEDAVQRFVTKEGQLVVEIGSNDGILLKSIQDSGVRVLGVDPAKNIAALANERGIETIPDFFSERLAKEIREKYGQARIIIGNNVVAHIDDHHDLIRGIDALLDEDGVFMFEAPYLVDMFENLTFDTVYHEHLSYFAVEPLVAFMASQGFEVFDVRTFPVQGVSLRTYVGRPGRHGITPAVSAFREDEKRRGLNAFSAYEELASRIAALKEDVRARLSERKKAGKRIAGYGAPAKGNTLLNYYGIGPETLEYATETLPSKIGLYTPGMHIPVIHIDEARKHPPDDYLLLAWNYQNAILEQEAEFRKKGGSFIVPVGHTRIV